MVPDNSAPILEVTLSQCVGHPRCNDLDIVYDRDIVGSSVAEDVGEADVDGEAEAVVETLGVVVFVSVMLRGCDCVWIRLCDTERVPPMQPEPLPILLAMSDDWVLTMPF